MIKCIKYLALVSFFLILPCIADVNKPKVATGTPASIKFWEAPDEKYYHEIHRIFGNKTNRYGYFAQFITDFISEDSGEAANYYIVKPDLVVFDDRVQILDTIFSLEKFAKKHNKNNVLDELRLFFQTNYKNQILPGYVYENNIHLPKPFYLKELRYWIFSAIDKNDINSLRALLDNYSLLDIKNDQGYGLLSYSILNSRNDLAMLLIRRGANINEINDNNETPFSIAVSSGNSEMVSILEKTDCIKTDKNIQNVSAYLDVNKESRHSGSLTFE
jgi:hypothetical protein